MEKIADVLKDAKRAIEEKGFLDLSDRKRIWRCFGDVPDRFYLHQGQKTPVAPITEGLKKRFALAELCFKKAGALHEAGIEAGTVPTGKYDLRFSSEEVDRILKITNQYLKGEKTVDELVETGEWIIRNSRKSLYHRTALIALRGTQYPNDQQFHFAFLSTL